MKNNPQPDFPLLEDSNNWLSPDLLLTQLFWHLYIMHFLKCQNQPKSLGPWSWTPCGLDFIETKCLIGPKQVPPPQKKLFHGKCEHFSMKGNVKMLEFAMEGNSDFWPALRISYLSSFHLEFSLCSSVRASKKIPKKRGFKEEQRKWVLSLY